MAPANSFNGRHRTKRPLLHAARCADARAPWPKKRRALQTTQPRRPRQPLEMAAANTTPAPG
eukprot:479102-Lingulodinium_polyedra.AAC.1